MNALDTIEKPMVFSTPPVLLAAWPGPGNAGTMAIEYLRYQLGAGLGAMLDMGALFSLSSVPVREGTFVRPAAPKCGFYVKENPAAILFECDTNLAEKESLLLVNQIVKSAHAWGVTRIFTLGAFLKPMLYTDRPEIHFAASGGPFGEELKVAGFKPLPDGELSGPIALVPTIAGAQGINAACILAAIPVYAATVSYPKASLELLKRLGPLLNFHVDLTEMETAVIKMESTFKSAETHLREVAPFILPSRDPVEAEHEEVPQEESAEVISSAHKEKIERLFFEASQDRSKAGELKKELDRWGIFREFEDRFLDLFKKPQDDAPGS